jgi:multidrug efflux pump subunit AcrA (membrane-fusion protein)
VFAVDADDKVVPKPVVLGPMHEGLRVVLKGLTPDDRVIIDGIANPAVRPDVKVKPELTETKAASN